MKPRGVFINARGETCMSQETFRLLNAAKIHQYLSQGKTVKHLRRRDRRIRNGSLVTS